MTLPSTKKKWTLTTSVWTGMALLGVVALIALLRIPSEPGSAVLFGFSRVRLLVVVGNVLALAVMAVFAAASYLQPTWWQKSARLARQACGNSTMLFWLTAGLFTVFISILAFLILAISPAALEMVALRTIVERMGALLVWGELVAVGIGGLLWLQAPPEIRQTFFTPLRLGILAAITTLVYTTFLDTYATSVYDHSLFRFSQFAYYPAAILLVRGVLYPAFRMRSWYRTLDLALLTLFLGALSNTLYRHTSQWFDWTSTPSKAYWNELASAFLNGRLYLTNPESTHDLTLFNGQWYVPNPPLPGLVMVPFVALLGDGNVNMVLFSIAWGAINVMLVFLILERASQLEMIPTSRAANLWLTAVFALGTSHWWLSILGRMWFTSQVLTFTCAAVALLLVMYRASPWWVGLFLGLALTARPNAFTLWPFLAGVALYLRQRDTGSINWKQMFWWSVQSAIPVVLAVMSLLYYNYIRFGSLFDFGYVTINSSDWLMSAVRTYGMFNPHFVPVNLNAMFFKLPILEMRGECLYFSPTREGVSMFVLTPALIYTFRRFNKNWWTIGAWSSIALSIGLLLFYHNTGAWQLGYRYLLDFILPVLLLMAVGIGRRVSWVFGGLCVLSIGLNLAGIIWWFEKWWC